MERRHFLKFAIGFAAGAAVLAARAEAAPLSPQRLSKDELLPSGQDVHPAVTSVAEVEQLKPEQVRWGHHGHGHHWGWHHHRRHWGWHRHHWRRHWRRWHRRYW
jgi:hypothetical protein